MHVQMYTWTPRSPTPSFLLLVISIGRWVSPDARRQKVGTALVQRVQQWARDEGCYTKLLLTVDDLNHSAKRLYESCDFCLSGVPFEPLQVPLEVEYSYCLWVSIFIWSTPHVKSVMRWVNLDALFCVHLFANWVNLDALFCLIYPNLCCFHVSKTMATVELVKKILKCWKEQNCWQLDK
jgi:hypothetical protein